MFASLTVSYKDAVFPPNLKKEKEKTPPHISLQLVPHFSFPLEKKILENVLCTGYVQFFLPSILS